MEKVFCVAIKGQTKMSYLTFGKHTTVSDIMDVLDEEVNDLNGTSYQIVAMSFLSSTNSKELIRTISDWTKEIEAKLEEADTNR